MCQVIASLELLFHNSRSFSLFSTVSHFDASSLLIWWEIDQTFRSHEFPSLLNSQHITINEKASQSTAYLRLFAHLFFNLAPERSSRSFPRLVHVFALCQVDFKFNNGWIFNISTDDDDDGGEGERSSKWNSNLMTFLIPGKFAFFRFASSISTHQRERRESIKNGFEI